MGWSVHDVKRASVWEFFSSWQGYMDANTPKKKGVQTEEEAEALFDRLTAGDQGPRTLSTQTYWLDGGRLVPMGVVTFASEN